MIEDYKNIMPKLVDIVEMCTALVNDVGQYLINQGFIARLLDFNNYLPLMMLKIKQANCLFVNSKKTKTKP
jgi:hypothetical protein